MTDTEGNALDRWGCVHIRLADDDRLHVARVDTDVVVRALDLVAVVDGSGVKGPARIAGPCAASIEPDIEGNRVVARYNIVQSGRSKVSDLLSCARRPDTPDSEHQWGALGLPTGPETGVSMGAALAMSDFDIALQSAGYLEAATNRLHHLVPGYRCTIGGEEVTITAIDRRKNEIELTRAGKQEVWTMPLDAFIEGEERG